MTDPDPVQYSTEKLPDYCGLIFRWTCPKCGKAVEQKNKRPSQCPHCKTKPFRFVDVRNAKPRRKRVFKRRKLSRVDEPYSL